MDEQIIGDAFDNRTMPAVMVLYQTDSPDSDAVIMQISDPHIDTITSTLSYTAAPISYSGTDLKSFTGYADQSLPDQFGPASIYYDPTEVSEGSEEGSGDQMGCDSGWKARCHKNGNLIGKTSGYYNYEPFQCVTYPTENRFCFVKFQDQCNSPDECSLEMISNCYWV